MVLWALFSLLYRIGLVLIAVAFTVQSSRGDKPLAKVGKFLGLVVSVIPIVGLFFYLGFKGRPSGYGEKCGVMALLGVLLYAIIAAGR
jgi:protein-S-isoprenylcysteine O-methyltransferase Ste14